MKKILLFSLLFFLGFSENLRAQNSLGVQIPTDRQLFHENVDRQQKRFLNSAGVVNLSGSEADNQVVTRWLIKRVDRLQLEIEADSLLNGNSKKKYLRSIEFMLRGFLENYNKTDFGFSLVPALENAFEECMRLDRNNESIFPVIQKEEYGVGKILVECFIFPSENPGVAGSRVELIRKYCGLHPDEILPVLSKNPNLYFADSLIRIASHIDIKKLYDYSAARNALGNRIRNHPDTLVQLVSRMANSRSGQLYFPFLDNLLRGKTSFEAIDSVKDNDFAYYRLLVKTRIDYFGKELPPYRDTAIGMEALTDMMSRKARSYFVREINALHSVNDESVRFKRLEGLTAQELYYLAVLSEDEIYTSSFVKGVYPRIFQRMSHPRGDSLILSVNGDYFRKFIKMCAGYNTLNDFLSRMDKGNDSLLMKAFVIGLERTKGMEEAVDVADSYSSIMDKNPELAGFILKEAKWNFDRNVTRADRRGKVIYNLLKILFESADSSSKVNLSKDLGIPPVYSVDHRSLQDDSGRIVMQVFFYGDEDKDGQHSFASFMSMFEGKPEWKVVKNNEWVSIRSSKGQPLFIFANRPLFGENDPEETAINHLGEYMAKRNLHPSIYVHRGHSYHVKSTMERIGSSARIVILGSCGGYNNINEVLSRSSDAHIISSKQTGTMHINEPIIQALNSSLAGGRDIDWIGMWKDLSARFSTGDAREKFDDYIPPYKNLGAIFIKAYNRAMKNP